MDLSSEHASELRKELARFVAAAHKAGGRRGRGRIPQDVYVKFQEARG
ncbi:hypothetical protein [Carbonactinospora thermoautotrophica]|nr:hypothetical protein [Carbonactinospora thermoautotrophica]